jgi:hypothetical protein
MRINTFNKDAIEIMIGNIASESNILILLTFDFLIIMTNQEKQILCRQKVLRVH